MSQYIRTKLVMLVTALLIPFTAVAEFTPEEATSVSLTIRAGREIRSTFEHVATKARDERTPENIGPLGQALTELVEAARTSSWITGDLVSAEGIRARFKNRTRQEEVDSAKAMVIENVGRIENIMAILSTTGLDHSSILDRNLARAISAYNSFDESLSYLDYQYAADTGPGGAIFPGLIGVSPDGKNIHGDYDLAAKWTRHTLFYGHDSIKALVVDFANDEMNTIQIDGLRNYMRRFGGGTMTNFHKILGMLGGICAEKRSDGFCEDSRFSFMQRVQALAGRSGSQTGFHFGGSSMLDIKREEDHTPVPRCANADCWSLAMLQWADSWRGLDKTMSAVILGFEGRSGVDFLARDLIIVDLENQLAQLEEELANCDGGIIDCSALQARIDAKNEHLRTIEGLAAQRTVQ